MKFLKNGDLNGNGNGNGVLKLILGFTLVYTSLLIVTNVLLYEEKLGFSYSTVIEYYLGDEEKFRNPVSFRSLLEGAHFHLFSFAIILLLLNHLMAFTKSKRGLKLLLVYSSFLSGLLEISSGWLIRFVSPIFAYLKITSFVVFHLSLLALLFLSCIFLTARNKM